MVHHVIKQVDRGEVIMTREVECHEGDDLQKLRENTASRAPVDCGGNRTCCKRDTCPWEMSVEYTTSGRQS